jgi:hypothetical protein
MLRVTLYISECVNKVSKNELLCLKIYESSYEFWKLTIYLISTFPLKNFALYFITFREGFSYVVNQVENADNTISTSHGKHVALV